MTFASGDPNGAVRIVPCEDDGVPFPESLAGDIPFHCHFGRSRGQRHDGGAATTVTIANQYDRREEHFHLEAGGRITVPALLATSFRWYDVIISISTDPSFVRHYAGHIENGFDSVSDPHIGTSD